MWLMLLVLFLEEMIYVNNWEYIVCIWKYMYVYVCIEYVIFYFVLGRFRIKLGKSVYERRWWYNRKGFCG